MESEVDTITKDFNSSIHVETESDDSQFSNEDSESAADEHHKKKRKISDAIDLPSSSAESISDKNELLKKCNEKAALDGKFFTIDLENSMSDGSIISATCSKCEKNIRGALRSSSNFVTHLKNVHPKLMPVYEKYKASKKIHTGRIRKPKAANVHCTFSQKQFEHNVTNFILDSMAPFRTVEAPSFRKIFNDFNITQESVKLKHLTTKMLKRNIDLQFDQDMEKIRQCVENEAKYFCTTSDIWSAKTRSFIGVTLHWIDPETLKRKSAAIACKRFAGVHSFDRIAKHLHDVHQSFGLEADKVTATVTDNASNFAKAFKEYGILQDDDETSEQHSDSSTLSENDNDVNTFSEDEIEIPQVYLPTHLRCASHSLNLVATTDALKIINGNANLFRRHKKTLSRCTELWNKTRSPKQLEILTELLGCSLRRPVVTRWNSLFESLKMILQEREKFTTEFYNIVNLNNHFSKDDFEYLEEYICCMAPLADAIDTLQGEEHCYYGVLLPTLISLKNNLHDLKSKKLKYVAVLIDGIILALEKRFADFFNIEGAGCDAAIAAALHPNFKLRWVKSLTKSIRNKVRPLVVQAAKDFQSNNLTIQPTVIEDKFNFKANNDNDSFNSDSFVEDITTETIVLNYLQEAYTLDVHVLKKTL